jgi:hypothetical protein
MTTASGGSRRRATPKPGPRPAIHRAEVADGDIEFEYDGDTYRLADVRKDGWDLGVLEAIEEDKYILAVKRMLGEEQWALFRSKRRGSADLLALFEAAWQAGGVRPGE